jgi:signal transduction histidine kinase
MRWLRIERLPVHEAEDTQPAGYYGIIVDITEERNSRQVQDELALRRAQFSTIDTFVKAISHDFRNRLSSIETTRYLISRQVSPESLERIKPRLDQISTHIDDMMMQLTNLTLINALNNPYLNSLNVNELCRTVYDKFVHQARTKSLQIRLELADAQPMLTADAEQLERALTHLLRNALTHTSTGGVTLRTTVEGECAIIEVEDTGYGIASKNLPLIFEPFYRGDDARTVTHAGVGLGLTLVRLIVEAHQGTIDVSSALGQGTTFRISLPMRDTLVA